MLREEKKNNHQCKACNTPLFSGLRGRGLWYCGVLWQVSNAEVSHVKAADPHQTKFVPFAYAKAGNFHAQANLLLLWMLWCWKDTLTGKGNTNQNYFIQNRGQSQAPGSQHRSFLLFSQDTDLWEDPQIRASIRLKSANNSSVIVLLN